MNEKKKGLTKEYFEVLGDVYRERGVLAAIGYDLSSTMVSALTKIENLFDSPAHKLPQSNISPYTRGRELGAGGWPRGCQGEDRYLDAVYRERNRNKERREHLLRHKKQKESPLADKVSVFALSTLAGIALSVFSFNATGNAVAGVTGTGQGLLGVLLFIVGISGMFFSGKK